MEPNPDMPADPAEPSLQPANTYHGSLFGPPEPEPEPSDLFAHAEPANPEPFSDTASPESSSAVLPPNSGVVGPPQATPTPDELFSAQIHAATLPIEVPSGGAFIYDPTLPAIERLLHGLVVGDGSDMHLVVGERPRYRIKGDLLPLESEDEFTGEALTTLMAEAAGVERWEKFQSIQELDFAYAMKEDNGSPVTSRFRVNYFFGMGQPSTVFRVIPTLIKTLDELGVPPVIKKLAALPRGLIFITGPTGSGKSTTGAALLDLINETRADRIFTIEDPIEFTHRSKRCLVSQREIGQDTESFATAMRAVRREDPDVIYVGEVRDLETMEAAIEAADTGHLVIATLHTSSAPETILRIINSFPAGKQDQIRTTLASSLKAVICQTLLKSKEKGRVAACEVMIVTPAISNCIRLNDIPAISNAMTDTSSGSILLDKALADLITSGLVSKKEALKKATSPERLETYLGTGHAGSTI